MEIPIINTFNKIIEKGTLPADYCTARLKLIPKKGDPTMIKNWRPITILNSKYKLLSACFTNRLKKVVDKIVGSRQKGFTSIRRAHKMVLNLSEYAKECINIGASSCIISFDFAQAFDSVDHGYIF